jgi:2-polyprenyl-3-methyl-5-hydroxy-6-metoxy-1,4-benzoquinol methylase
MLKCDSNDHLVLETSFTSEQLQDLYSNYYPRTHFNIDEWKPNVFETGFKIWLNGLNCSAYRWVPENIKILDIGCGFGETLGYHTARGCEVYGVEADDNIKRVAEKFNFNVKVGLFSAEDYPKEYFDYVTMDQVIEHVSGPLNVLKDIAFILKPGGTLILSTPNAKGWGIKFFGRKWIHWHTPYHLQIFSNKSLKDYAEKAGFVLERSRTITHSDWLYFQWIHLVTRPQYGSVSNFWRSDRPRGLGQKIMIKLITILHKLKLNHLITRLFDSLELGDNRIYFLRKELSE